MSKPEEISAPQPNNLGEVQEVSWLVLALADRLQQNFANRASEFALSGPQAKALLALRSDEAIPMRQLARRLHYDASNLTSLVDKLEEQAIAKRGSDTEDRRIKTIVLTEKGLHLRESFQERLGGDAGPLAALNDSQIRSLRELLEVVLERD